MSDRDALLAAILAEPEDDTPRLVYADWLEEHGEAERAEFIRVQCRLPHLSARSAEAKRLKAREAELRPKLFAHLDALPYEVTHRRGFVDSVSAGILDFLDGEPLSPPDAAAFAIELLYDDRDAEMFEPGSNEQARALGDLAQRSELRRCVSLSLPCLHHEPFEAIIRSPNLTALRRLSAPDNEAGPWVELVASPTFVNLRWANFHNSDSFADCPSIIPLVQCPHLANLEYLDFGMCEQGDEQLAVVAEAPHWDRLAYLNLSGGYFTTDAAADFFHTRRLPALAELDLSHSTAHKDRTGKAENGDRFASLVADSPLFARLKTLRLQAWQITDAGAKALAASPRKVKLAKLDLTDNPIGEEARQALADRFGAGVCAFEEPRE